MFFSNINETHLFLGIKKAWGETKQGTETVLILGFKFVVW